MALLFSNLFNFSGTWHSAWIKRIGKTRLSPHPQDWLLIKQRFSCYELKEYSERRSSNEKRKSKYLKFFWHEGVVNTVKSIVKLGVNGLWLWLIANIVEEWIPMVIFNRQWFSEIVHNIMALPVSKVDNLMDLCRFERELS